MEIINNYIKSHFEDSIAVKNQILNDKSLIDLIQEVAIKVTNAYKNGNKTLLAGNGGSAADAQHIAGEFVSRFYFDRPGIPSIALSTDTSILTAIGNDYGYEKLFARQVQAHGVKGDVFIGISTSGKMVDLCDYCIKVPLNCTPRIQESHIVIGHIICAIVEEEIFGKGF